MNPYTLHFRDQNLQQEYKLASNFTSYKLCKIGMAFCSVAWIIRAIIAAIEAKFWVTILMLVAFAVFIPLFIIVYRRKYHCTLFLTSLFIATLITHFEALIASTESWAGSTFQELFSIIHFLSFLNLILLIFQTSWISQTVIAVTIQVYYIVRLHFATGKTYIDFGWGLFLAAQIIFFYIIDRARRDVFIRLNAYKQQSGRVQSILEEHIPEKVVIVNESLNKVLFFNKPFAEYFRTTDEKELLHRLNRIKPKIASDVLYSLGTHNKLEFPSGLLDIVSSSLLPAYIGSCDLESGSDKRAVMLNDYYNPSENQESHIDIVVKQVTWNNSTAYLIVLSELSEKVVANRLKLADIFKNRLVASFSNEFRTPLNGILGFVSQLKKKTKTNRDLEILEMVESSAKVLLISIDSLIDLMILVKDQKIKLQIKALRVKIFAEEIQQLISPYFQNKNVSFNLDIQKDILETLYTDEIRLKEALIHLLLNAIKFTYQGQITLSIKRCVEDNDILLFTVQDTGLGIKPEDVPHLFKMNLKDSPDDSYQKGVGLGLQISQKLARLFGKVGSKYSNIIVESEFGKGSKFTVGVDITKFAQNGQCEVVQSASEGHILIDFNVAWRSQAKQNDPEMLEMIPLERGFYDKRIKVFKAHNSLNFGGSEENLINDRPNNAYDLPVSGFEGKTSKKLQDNREHGKITESEDFLPHTLKSQETYQGIELVEKTPHNLPQFSSMQHLLDRTPIHTNENNTDKEKILVVDDTAFNLLVAKSFLEELGYYVKTALNGKEAIEMAMQEDYNDFFKIIFMDCQMPVLDGYQATRILKDKMMKNQIPLTPIVAITANKNQVDIDKCFEAGMDAFLSKPITKDMLRNQIKEIFPEAKIP